MKPQTTLEPRKIAARLSRLARGADEEKATARRPVHTVYGGAHLFRRDTAHRLGELALRALSRHAPDAESLATALGLDAALARPVYERVVEKLKREPVEDYRIDFEDGYGPRPDAEEDAHAAAAAEELARGFDEGLLPPFIGLRIKALDGATARRGARTLDVFLTALVRRTKGRLPPNFRVTLPKVSRPEQCRALAGLLSDFERAKRLSPGSIRAEIMVESPDALVGPDGASPLRALHAALGARADGVHFGAYDYTAACAVAASHQNLSHPACVFARAAMQAALYGTGAALSDGATTILPAEPHRAEPGRPLTPEQERENAAAVRGAWRAHFDDASRTLAEGFDQGWDLHPAQLVSRHAAVYAFFLAGLPSATRRLRGFLERCAQATRAGGAFDDAATGRGLLNFFRRGLDCGALGESELAAAGVTAADLRSDSFHDLARRRGAP